MKAIELTNGGHALVDDLWFEILNVHRWTKSPQGYAHRSINVCGEVMTLLMHRIVAQAPPKALVDHKNRNPLDNQSQNLRLVNKSINAINCKVNVKNTSGFKCVSFRKDIKKWKAEITRAGKHFWLGAFETPHLAHNAVIKFLEAEKAPALLEPELETISTEGRE